MSIASSEKIFIDSRDEITFVVERVLGSDKERIIIVVPQNSLLLSSIVSIDILFRKIVKSKKLAIIVTEDEYGKNIATRAGFIVVKKVSLINTTAWEEAKVNKLRIAQELEKRKKELLSNITESREDSEHIIPAEEPTDFEVNAVEENGVLRQVQDDNSYDEAPGDESSTESQSDATSEIPPFEIEQTPVERVIAATAEEPVKPKEEEGDIIPYRKKRKDTHIINVDGISIVAGGDIKNYIDTLESDKIESNLEEENMADSSARKIKNTSNKLGNFTGRDFTKAVNGESKIKNFLNKIFKPKRIIDPNERFEGISENAKKSRRKVLIGFILVVLIFALGGGYVLAFQLSTVDVTLKLKKQDVTTSANLVVDPNATAITYEPITIPGKIITITSDKLSMSRTGTADGTGKRGNKAKGVIDIYNVKVDKDVTFPAGTVFTCRDTGKKYKLTQDTTITAAKPGSSSNQSDVPIEAVDFGPDYNLDDSSSNTVFLVDNYTEEQLYGKRYKPITGGTVEEFTSVSQDNFDKLKDAIMPDLKKQATDKISQQIDPGYKIIDGSITFDESQDPKSFPAVGEEAKDKTFNLTVQIGVSALEVKNDDLVNAVKYILQNAKATDPNNKLVVNNVNDPQITKVDKNDSGQFVLGISSQGSVQTQVTIDQMKKDISGLSIEQANDYFHFLDYLDEYKITFTPSIVPESIRRIPTDMNRIKIKTI